MRCSLDDLPCPRFVLTLQPTVSRPAWATRSDDEDPTDLLVIHCCCFFTVQFQPSEDWRAFVGQVTAGQLTFEVEKIGGILLVIGLLHGLNIILMPVLGRLFSLNRRLPNHGDYRPPDHGDRKR